MIGATISHYRIVEKLGEGGMGVVYKAEDTRLGRFAALKFLPADVTGNPQALARLTHEARAASALNHPNICTIYEIGDDDDHTFIAMEYLDGAPLAQLVASGLGRDMEKLLDIAIDVSDALAAAHSQGVIHRDIKAGNIMLTKRGSAKIVDFGLAKVADERCEGKGAESDATVTTQNRGLTGTLAYMSPEQVRCKRLDGRSDLFSFGVVLYEMATGIRPFRGDAAALVCESILHAIPVAPVRLNPDIPPELERIIETCLEKDPELRYQHPSDLRSDLKKAKRALAFRHRSRTGMDHNIAASAELVMPSLLTKIHRQRKRLALLGGAVLLFALLASGISWRLFRKPAMLTDKDTMVLADFSNSTQDAVFDDTLKQALATDLQQSPFLSILPDQKVRETLRLMGHAEKERLVPDVALELCQRTGSKALLTGSISSLGSQYVLGLNATNCQTGDSLARETAEVTRKESVLQALGGAASKLRAKLGESLATLQKYDVPISEATTPSLEALKSYSVGIRANLETGPGDAIPLYQRALELDPNFASAQAGLGVAYGNLGELDLARASFQKAYDLRGKVSEREKLRISAYYYRWVTGEMEKANQSYELWAQAYPREFGPRNNLGVNYAVLGLHEKALAETLESIRANPDVAISHGNLVGDYCRLNRLNEAKAAYEQALMRKLDHPDLHYNRYGVAFLEGDAEEMGRQMAWCASKPGLEDFLVFHESNAEAFFGHIAKARELSQHSVESAQRVGRKEVAAVREINSALREAEFGDLARARQATTSALALAPTRNVKTLAALALARSGDSRAAEKIADELEKQNPLDSLINGYWLPTIRAAIEIDRSRPSEALEILRSAAPHELGETSPPPEVGATLYPVYVRGQAYLDLHQGNAARAEFQKFLDLRGLVIDCPLGALARLQLARAAAMYGDKQVARQSYEEFLLVWKDADPNIPALKQAKREYASLL